MRDEEIIALMRHLLKSFDDGLCTSGEVTSLFFHRVLKDAIQRVNETGEEGGWGTSVCGGEGAPTYRAILEVGPGKPLWLVPLLPRTAGKSPTSLAMPPPEFFVWAEAAQANYDLRNAPFGEGKPLALSQEKERVAFKELLDVVVRRGVE